MRLCNLLVLLSIYSLPKCFATDDLQQQVHKLLVGSGGTTSNLSKHDSGLILPPYIDASNWLQEYWQTGMRRNASNNNVETSQLESAYTVGGRKGGGWPWPTAVMQGGENSNKDSICGAHPSQLGQGRRNVLISPVGDYWQPEKWLNDPQHSTFDIIAIYHGENESFTCPLCAQVHHIKGPKWRLYLELASNDALWRPIADAYDYIMLPDDDLIMDTCAINKVFSIMQDYDLLLAQPSVCEVNGSGTWRPELHQRVQYLLRYTTFVEVMSPAFRTDFFDNVVRRTFSKYWTYVGWGLDSVWPALLLFPKDRIGVVDAVCMTHIPSEGGLGASLKPNSIYRLGLSPYSPKQEELIVFSAFNYTPATTNYFNEPFMSSRVVGAVPNDVVVGAMVKTLGRTVSESITGTASSHLGQLSSLAASTTTGISSGGGFMIQLSIAVVAAVVTMYVTGKVMSMRRSRVAWQQSLNAMTHHIRKGSGSAAGVDTTGTDVYTLGVAFPSSLDGVNNKAA